MTTIVIHTWILWLAAAIVLVPLALFLLLCLFLGMLFYFQLWLDP